jgi:hypothetical protein
MSESEVRIIPGQAFCQPQLEVLSKLTVDSAALTAKPIRKQLLLHVDIKWYSNIRGQQYCSAQIVRIFLSTPVQLAAKQRKEKKEKETLIGE